MINFLQTYFSPEKKAARLEKKLQKAVSDNDQQKIISIFCKEFMLLLQERKADLLSNLIISYSPKIEDIALLEKKISSSDFKQAISFLEKNKLEDAALKICDYFEFDTEAIEILAKQGQANELFIRITKDSAIDKELLQTAITCWEKYNGDIRKNLTIVDIIRKIAKFSGESFPDNPRVKEIVGQFKEAASLYFKENDLGNAARCYEEAEMH